MHSQGHRYHTALYQPAVTKCPGEHTQYTGTYLSRKITSLTKRKSQLHIRCAQIYLDPQFSSAAQLCLTLWDPMYCSTPGFPVQDQFTEPTQTHVHWVSDAIQSSHPLSSPSPPSSIFTSIRVFSNESFLHISQILEFHCQHQSFQ